MLRATLAAAAAPMLAPVGARAAVACIAGAGAVTPAAGAPRRIVVYDGRYPVCDRYARASGAPPRDLIDTRDDVARCWYGGLADAARRERVELAGLTTWADFVVLRGCAAEAGLRATDYEILNATRERCGTLVRWRMAGRRT